MDSVDLHSSGFNQNSDLFCRHYSIIPKLHKFNLSEVSILIVMVLIMSSKSFSQQQISIPRIDSMPNMPSPYLMRDWKKVAFGYDSLVFDLNAKGEYLPLVWVDNASINYSGPRFGLSTVVGTPDSKTNEAINCIPAVVGATLAGIDKSNQNEYNWVSMCQEWFNKQNGAMVYMNHPDDITTTDDWWYEVMPNVFFYQLYSLYPNTGDFHDQFISVADQWLKAVYVMGGSTTPWKVPYMKYQGWDFSTMQPSPLHQHDEPEAAGAIAWLLYNAYKVTGNPKYRIGAELSMEYLNSLTSNPAYELQLGYGVYIAARMNAELGTNYDVNKMLNWCFNTDNIRNWGAMANANWGGLDCDGLIGEVNGTNNYPFAMNGFELAGDLVPMVRYDSRFATAIGKWVLNLANASRLFYPKYLPAANQDQPSWQWASQYDTNSYIAHESMHQYNPSNFAVSPYAMGDAESGGWGNTNLALYGASHVGILAGIIDTTNIPGILQLNVLKTDYFHDTAYPTYLYYNPYNTAQSVQIDLGIGTHDVYDVVSKTFLIRASSGITSITIPANSSILAVITPSGGTQNYVLDKFLINGVIVDYHSGRSVANYLPRIKSLSSTDSVVTMKDSIQVYCTAVDEDNDQLSYKWTSSGGIILGSGSQVTWISPDSEGLFEITCIVSDSAGAQTQFTDTVRTVKRINQVPVIIGMTAQPRKINLGSSSTITFMIYDSDGDTLKYNWSAAFGIISGSDSSITWTAPNTAGNYYVKCTADDGNGGTVNDSIDLEVRDLSVNQTGQLVAYYPFDGNANDLSGNNNNGIAFNTTPVPDRFGNPNGAYSFDGTSSYVQIPSSSSLNFQNSITINFWMKPGTSTGQEEYVISQGSYDNRLKISIIQPENKLRWTIKTTTGIKDLDSETKLVQDSLYNVTVDYNGSDIEIYINGNLDSFDYYSGTLLTTTIPLMFGEMLPNNSSYNYRGILDDIRIYNYALPLSEIEKLGEFTTDIKNDNSAFIPKDDMLMQNYPNPFNPSTNISFYLKNNSHVTLEIFNSLGQVITKLIDNNLRAGRHDVVWNADSFASGIYFYELKTDSKIEYRKMVLLK